MFITLMIITTIGGTTYQVGFFVACNLCKFVIFCTLVKEPLYLLSYVSVVTIRIKETYVKNCISTNSHEVKKNYDHF